MACHTLGDCLESGDLKLGMDVNLQEALRYIEKAEKQQRAAQNLRGFYRAWISKVRAATAAQAESSGNAEP